MAKLTAFHERFAYFRRWFFIYLAVTISVPALVVSVVALIDFVHGFTTRLPNGYTINLPKYILLTAVAFFIYRIFTSISLSNSNILVNTVSHWLQGLQSNIPRLLKTAGVVVYLCITLAAEFDLIDFDVDPVIWHGFGLIVCYLLVKDVISNRTTTKGKLRPDD
jgi:hypothetical protein